MHAGDINKFYQKVIKNFINKINQDPVIAQQLQSHRIEMSQLQKKIKEKMKEPKLMFKRAINGSNEIQKERSQMRYLQRSSQIDKSPVQTPKIKQEVVEEKSQDDSYSNDLDYITHHREELQRRHNQKIGNIAKRIKGQQLQKSTTSFQKITIIQQRGSQKKTKIENQGKQQDYNQKEQDERIYKRSASDYLIDDFSDIEQEDEDSFKKMRQNAKIHVIATYDPQSKKHKFNEQKTHVMLENVFIKVEGLNKQIFLKKLHYTSQKKTQN